MLRRTFLSILRVVPLALLPERVIGLILPRRTTVKVGRYRGWDITWTELNSPTALGAWMGVPTSKEELLRKNHAAMRTLVPRGDGSNPEHRKLVGLRRLEYMIGSDWKPRFWIPHGNHIEGYWDRPNTPSIMESPFAKPKSMPDANV